MGAAGGRAIRDGLPEVRYSDSCGRRTCDRGTQVAMTLWENTRASLSALPLLDAAYRLWMERRKLDLEEVPTRPAPTVSSASPPDDGAIREAIENVLREQITAP